ncbi:unnamed protein product [Effrenium voratum]|uniref:Uncharacterized protein n=1 Tax=Effrenium voratum TaxID=2562239 RepID=A0AA36I7Z4_9DINO|nr:unnamed protein product [Effrenium voratum]
MPFMEVGGVVDLATPEKGLVRWSPSLPRTPQGAASAVEADIQDSPRLPSDWSPLEYELLEYADSLPPGFAERIARELEGQQQRVAQLRSLNSLMLHVLRCEAPSPASAPTTPAVKAQFRKDPSPPNPPPMPKAWQDASMRLAHLPPNCREEVSRRLVLASASRQLEMQVLEVRRAAEQELYDLASRARVAEESNWKLRREQNNEDAGRKNLWEAEAKLNKLQTRVQQLEARRRNVQRKALQREEEVRQLSQTNAQMQAEICSFRGAVKDFDASVGREQQLRISRLRHFAAGVQLRPQGDGRV